NEARLLPYRIRLQAPDLGGVCMASANTKLLMIGAITVAIGLVPLLVSGWFIFYTLPLILAGIGMMAFAGLRSAVAFGGIEGSRATILVGGLMMVQYPIV